MSVDIAKVVTPSVLAKSPTTFIFEPKDLVPFQLAWKWQQDWQRSLLSKALSSQAVWLLQHSSCYTLGRGASLSNVLFDKGGSPSELFRIDRGGEVTHHLPGQLVVYPVLDLRHYKKDLNWYLRQLEEVLIDALRVLGLDGQRIPGFTGIWVQGRKVAAIGVGCRRWITQHGFALNVDCDLAGFDEIVPCGLKGKPVENLSNWLPGITVADVQPLVRRCLCERFDLISNSSESYETS